MFSRRLKIRLDGGEDQVYRPGYRVSGHVEFKSPVEDRLTSMTIELRGVIKVLNESSVRKEQVELFHFSKDLFDGNRTLEPKQPFACSFDFALPEMTRFDRTGLYRDREHPLFHDRPHPLPPSLSSKQSGHTQVIYSLYAKAVRCQDTHGGPDQGKRQLLSAEIENLCLRPGTTNLSSSPAQPLERKLTIPSRKSWSIVPSNFTTRRQQRGILVVVLNAPSTIVLGREIPISFLVRYEGFDAQDSCSAPPSCHHKTTAVAIEAKTHRRSTPRPYRAKNTDSRLKRLGTDHGYGTQPLGTSIQARKFPSDAIHDWPPSFKSYGVARTYDLLVDITVICRDYNHDLRARFRVPDINVVAPGIESLQRIDGGSPADLAPLVTYRPRQAEDDELPPYRPRSVLE